MATAFPNQMARIFTACHGTQLLVIQHLRRHLPRPPAREFLIWHPYADIPFINQIMGTVVPAAGFDGTLDIRDFQSLKPRTQGPLSWWFESTRRLRGDADALRAWMATNGIDEENVELWSDEPIHFNVSFLRGLLSRARHVKIPHCFNHEDCTVPDWKKALQAGWTSSSWRKRLIFLPWQRWTSGVDMRMEQVAYDRGYTFALPSPWSADSVDASALISLDAFASTYSGLASSLRAEVDTMLEPIRTSSKPLLLLLLFGFNDDQAWRPVYQRALARIFSERAAELRNCTVAVKWHPGATGEQEQILVDWLSANLPAQVYEIPHPLNLEFMLPQLQPDFVLAGLCGSLPIVRDTHIGRPVMLAELMPPDVAAWPGGQRSLTQFLQGIEVW